MPWAIGGSVGGLLYLRRPRMPLAEGFEVDEVEMGMEAQAEGFGNKCERTAECKWLGPQTKATRKFMGLNLCFAE